MNRLLQDLRFFIGLFFVIVGALLTVQSLVHPEDTAGVNLNFDVGLAFLIFGGSALALAYRSLRNVS